MHTHSDPVRKSNTETKCSITMSKQSTVGKESELAFKAACHAHSGEVCLAGREAWKRSWGKEFHGSSPPGVLAFSLTHILIPYSCVSLVYGTTSSLLIFYYKCLLRLNSVIVFQGPSSLQAWNLSFKSGRNAERKLPIQLLIKHYKDSTSELVYKIFTKDSSNSHPNEGTIELENPTETEIFSTARYRASH